jgi:hypothetical protein
MEISGMNEAPAGHLKSRDAKVQRQPGAQQKSRARLPARFNAKMKNDHAGFSQRRHRLESLGHHKT